MKKLKMICCMAFVLMALVGCQAEEVEEAAGDGNHRVGSAKVGYVDVPEDFVKFQNDVDLGEGTIQYSDASGKNVITLQYFDASVVDAEAAASTMYMQFSNDAQVDQESLTAAMVTLDGCEAYQVYCYYPADAVYVVTWSFDSPEDDYTHYVAIEFTADNFDLFELVESTYSVAK